MSTSTTDISASPDAARSRPVADGNGGTAARRKNAPDEVSKPPRGRHPLGWLLLALPVIAGLAAGAWYVFVRQGEEETYLELQGNIDVRQVNLSFKVDGRIETLAVDEGDAVKAGKVVATLDKRYFEDELRVAQARRDNLAAALAEARTRLAAGRDRRGAGPDRRQGGDAGPGQGRLCAIQGAGKDSRGGQQARPRQVRSVNWPWPRRTPSTPTSRSDWRRSARAAKTSTPPAHCWPRRSASIIQIERKLADSNLVAPNDGFILTRSREIGAIVQPGETVFTLTLASPVWVRTYVNERDLGLVRPGMPASVTTDTAPDRPYSAHVGFISPTAEFTPKTVETREIRTNLVYRLRVVVDNPDGGLRQGMPVTVKTRLPRPRRLTLWQRLRGGG